MILYKTDHCGERGGGTNRERKIPISFSLVFGEKEAPEILFLN